MTTPPHDTDPDALRTISSLYAEMTPEAKLRRVRDLTLAANRLSLAGLRRRHPQASESELLLRLARIRLGEQIVARAYGVPAEPHGP